MGPSPAIEELSELATFSEEMDDIEISTEEIANETVRKVLGKNITNIDNEINEIEIDDDTKIVFLLGAGASVPSGIPAVGGLLDELMQRGKKMQNDDINNLVKYCENNPVKNIEDVLTAAYLADFATENNQITSLVDFFLFSGDQEDSSNIDVSSVPFLQETLQTLFNLLMSTMIPARPNRAHKTIVNLSKDHPNTSIITTNYDGCVDEAILRQGHSIGGSIGNEIDSGLIGNNEHYEPDQADSEYSNFFGLIDEIDSQKFDKGGEIELIKMHGSINWTYCESCQRSQEFNLILLKELYHRDMISYPVTGICPYCGGRRQPLLVPPTAFKFLRFPPLVDMWKSAKERVEKADYVFMIGYSFSDSDAYINKMISKSMIDNSDQEMIVIDKNEELAPKIQEDLQAYGGVSDERIHQAVGNAEELVPQILESMYDQSIVPAKKIEDDFSKLTDISGIGDNKAEHLRESGFETPADVYKVSQNKLSEVEGIGNALAARIKADINSEEYINIE